MQQEVSLQGQHGNMKRTIPERHLNFNLEVGGLRNKKPGTDAVDTEKFMVLLHPSIIS